ncbi:MAG: SPFH domain-containing protein [Candidatus Gracilibacteria bacterium]|nr:SPFH domain-containing protein [Candidatus Gracilibacteria bacterium]
MGVIILTLEILFGLVLFAIPGPGVVIAIFYFIVLLFAGVVIVKPNTVRTKEVFGKYTGILRQGFNLVIPFITITRGQELYRKNFPVEVSGVTHDNVTAYIGLNVIYYVVDEEDDSREGNIYKSVYNIDDPKTMMKATIDEQLRAMIVSFTHKDIFAKREEIGNAIEERLREKLATFGYKLDSIQVRDVNLEAKVMAAMNKVVESSKLKEAAYNEAEAHKIMQVKEAEAEKESKILLGEGMAGQRLKIAEGFKESIDMIKSGDDSLNAEKILTFLLDSSRIETLGNIGSKDNSKLIYLNEDLEGRSNARESKLIAGSDIM